MEKKLKRPYTRGEEIFSSVSHILGIVFGIVVLVLGVVFAAGHSGAYGIVSMSIYGVSIIILYLMSTLYHSFKEGKVKSLFRIFDHCSIFFLIAGTYTPICLVALRESGAWGWTLFGIIWGFAIIGITFNAINMHNKLIKRLSMIAYIAMGWCAILAIVPLINALSSLGFWLLISGGIVYTVGAVFYAAGKKIKYIHSVWHLFVLAGSVLHFFSILSFLL